MNDNYVFYSSCILYFYYILLANSNSQNKTQNCSVYFRVPCHSIINQLYLVMNMLKFLRMLSKLITNVDRYFNDMSEQNEFSSIDFNCLSETVNK